MKAQLEEMNNNLDEDMDVIEKLEKQIKDLGYTPVVDGSALQKSRISGMSGGSRQPSKIRLNITDEN